MLMINSYLKEKISIVVICQMSVTISFHDHENMHEIISSNGFYSLINLNLKNSLLFMFLFYLLLFPIFQQDNKDKFKLKKHKFIFKFFLMKSQFYFIEKFQNISALFVTNIVEKPKSLIDFLIIYRIRFCFIFKWNFVRILKQDYFSIHIQVYYFTF